MNTIKKISSIMLFIYRLLRDKELMHFAASLSFHTMLSIIPVLFISLSIFTKLSSFDGYYSKIKDFIFSNLLPSQSITEYIDQFLSNSSGLGVMGVIAVFFTSIMFFGDYEFVISKITGAKKRSFWRNVSNYWSLITLAPLGLGLSFWLSSIIQSVLSQYTTAINFLVIVPYIIIWGMFFVTYTISINKEFSLANLLISSFCSSCAWSISKWIFVKYSFYNKTYASIYGSFSILLFFFLWIYISWIIFLYGIKILTILERSKKNPLEPSQPSSKDL